MALVVLLKGINVGGHRSFRPSVLAQQLPFDVVNVGAAGTFVVHGAPRRTELRVEIERRLPFAAAVAICDGNDILRLVSRDPFAGRRSTPDLVPFVSTMVRSRTHLPFELPLLLPSARDWCLRVLARHDRFLVGVHRRNMQAIRELGRLEQLVATPLTTRSWTTMQAIARVLGIRADQAG